jgi:LacI family transcriptional regulator
MQVPVDEEISACEEVSHHVRRLIASGELKRGAKLPSYRELALELGVAPLTAKRGVDLLAEQGIVSRRQRQGCFVNRELTPLGRPLKTIGIIHPASQKYLFSTPYLLQIMQGINGGHERLDVHIFTMREEGLVTATQLADRHVDGVILLGVENDTYLREFVKWGVPGVVADYFTDGIPLDFVACDNPNAVQRAVRHLVGLGHRNICYVGNEPTLLEKVAGAERMETRSADYIERRETAIGAMEAIPVRWKESVIPRLRADRIPAVGLLAAAWREEADRPTAFLTDGDDLASLLIRELVARGVRVPGEVSVCTVATATGRTEEGQALTGARFNFVGMGRKAVELLKQRCEQPAGAPPPAVHRIGFEWEEGNTVGRLQTADYRPQTADYRPQTTDHRLGDTGEGGGNGNQ